MKICTKCNMSKVLESFSKRSVNKDVLKSSCKDCDKELTQEYYKEYYKKNKEILSEYKRQHYIDNKDIYLKKAENWRENNKELYLDHLKEWRENNKEYSKEYLKEWKTNNRDKIRKYDKDFREINPHIVAWRSSLKLALKRLGYKKESLTIDLLDYSANDLRNHMEELFLDGMSWNNWGEWHIDHKIPLSKFKENTPIHIVNSLDNLQPLWAFDNLSKSNKLNE